MEVFISASKVSSRDRIGLDESLTLSPATPFHFSKQTSKTFNDSLPRKNEDPRKCYKQYFIFIL